MITTKKVIIFFRGGKNDFSQTSIHHKKHTADYKVYIDSFKDYTGLFISPSGFSELDCATTKTDTAERSISTGTESLQVFFCTSGLGVLPGSTARG